MLTSTQRQLTLAALLLLAFAGVALLLSLLKPKPHFKTEVVVPVLKVEAKQLQAEPTTLTIKSFGTVQARTQTTLVSQVSGVIVEVNAEFRDGGFFNKGDILLTIDDRDYIAAAKSAEAQWVEAKLNLAEEEARVQQALNDWQRLGNGAQPSDLVLRKPQLAAAQAKVISTRANYDTATLDLERTRIRAPYDGRIKSKSVDLGQYISAGNALADVFATDVIEIRLPLKNSDLGLIELPEDYRGLPADHNSLPKVTITSDLGTTEQWHGRIVRTEAAMDENTQQLFIIAQIENPYLADRTKKKPLKIGQYVTADIEGRHLPATLVVPTRSLYQGTFVYTVENDQLQRREVTVLAQTDKNTIIASGVEAGEWVVTSPLGQMTSGTRVAIANQGSESVDVSALPAQQGAQ